MAKNTKNCSLFWRPRAAGDQNSRSSPCQPQQGHGNTATPILLPLHAMAYRESVMIFNSCVYVCVCMLICMLMHMLYSCCEMLPILVVHGRTILISFFMMAFSLLQMRRASVNALPHRWVQCLRLGTIARTLGFPQVCSDRPLSYMLLVESWTAPTRTSSQS